MDLPWTLSGNITVEHVEMTTLADTSLWNVSEEVMFYFRAINISIVCLIFNVIGVVTNVINLIIFWRLGFKDSVNISLYALAISDFGACVSLLWFVIAMNPWFRQLELNFEPDEVSYLTSAWPHVAFTKVTTLITAFISFERCLCVTIPFKVKTFITPGKAKASLAFFYLLIVGLMAPLFYCTRLGWKFYPELNKTMLGLVFTEDRAMIETVIFSILNSFLSFFSVAIIAVCTIVLVINLRKKTKWRQSATTTTSSDASLKERKVAKMVVVISTLFIVCFIPNAAMALLMMAVREVAVDGKYARLNKAFAGFSFTAESVNSSMNAFIYYHNSSNYRAVFERMFPVLSGKQCKPHVAVDAKK